MEQNNKGDWYFQELSTNPKDARLDFMNSGLCPLTLGHDGPHIGTVIKDSAFLNNGAGYANIRFSNNSLAQKVLWKVINGSAKAVSIGAKAVGWVGVPSEDGNLPRQFISTWEPYEISVVAKGSDSGARILI